MSLQELINDYFYFDYCACHAKSYSQRVYFLEKREQVAKMIKDWYTPDDV